MFQKRIQTTLLGSLESVGLRGFYFLQKQKVAKTFAKIRTSCGFYFVFGLPRLAKGKSRNDEAVALLAIRSFRFA